MKSIRVWVGFAAFCGAVAACPGGPSSVTSGNTSSGLSSESSSGSSTGNKTTSNSTGRGSSSAGATSARSSSSTTSGSGASGNCASVPPDTELTDEHGNTYTVIGGQIAQNGVIAPSTGEVILVLLDRGLLYQENEAGNWFSTDGSGWPTSTWADLGMNANPCVSGSTAASTTSGGTRTTTGTGTTAGTGTTTGTGGTMTTSGGSSGVTVLYPNLVPSPTTFFTAAGPVNPNQQVFAHYMVCCGTFGGQNGGVAGAIQDIVMAQAMGITGFALNVGAWSGSPGYQTAVANMFSAAHQLGTGFLLFLSADMTGLATSDVVSILSQYATDPSYFSYNGRPVLSTFAGEALGQSAWTSQVLDPLAALGIDVFFTPGFITGLTNGANLLSTYGSYIDGFTDWQSLDVFNNDAANDIAIPQFAAFDSTLAASGKILMAMPFNQYWGARQPSNGNIYYDWSLNGGMNALWRAIIADGVPWVEIGTWNDFGESYMLPIDDFEKYNNWGVPLGWWQQTFGDAEELRYYINWFRTGVQPTITRDAIIYRYRTTPATATAANADLPGLNVQTGPVTRFVPNPPTGSASAIADDIYVDAFLTAPGQIDVSSGGTELPPVTFDAGFGSAAFAFVPGQQVISLLRNGAPVLSVTGAPIVANPPYYDFWRTSGFIE